MNLSDGLLPVPLLWAMHALYGVTLALAIRGAPWRRLRDSGQLNVFLGATVALLLIWSLKAGIRPGLDLHLLGATLLTLMFGWQLALVAVSLVLLGITLNGGGDFATFSVNALVMGALPIGLSTVVQRGAIRYLPHQFFVYVIVNAYFCAGLAMGAVAAGASLLLLCCGPYDFGQLSRSFLPFVPFMIFAEGFFTGMLAASLALMRPEWIWSFDDRRYLAGK